MNTPSMYNTLALLKRMATLPGQRGRSLMVTTLVFVTLLVSPRQSRAQVAQQDSLALVAFYNATGGPNWRNKESWLTGPVSSWHGVTVEQGRVTTLDLNANQLSGAIPPALGQLTGLHYLYLYENQLTGPIPPELGGLTGLWALWLNDNQLTGSIPAELGGLTELQALVLTNNRLTGSLPAELGQMTSLMGLHLAENRFTGAIPPELGRLTNLNDLRFYQNQLTGSIPPELGGLRKLERLYLHANQLTGTVPLELGNMRTMLEMNLSDNPDLCKPPQADRWWTGSHLQTVAVCQYTGLAADSLALVTFYHATGGPNWTHNDNWLAGPVASWHGVQVEDGRVTELKLEENGLTGSLPAELGQLTGLKVLDLTNNQLSGPIPPELGRLTNLEKLSLYINQLTGTIPAELGQLSRVADLYLGSNQLTGAIPPELGQLRMLVWLGLCGNHLTGAIPAELGALANLTHLYLCTNQLTGPIPGELNRLPRLRQLLLHNNLGLCKPSGAAGWMIADKISDLSDCETTGAEDREKIPRDTTPDASPGITLADLVGTYERQPVENFIYTGTMVQRGDRMHWTFGWDPDDGKGFDLIPDLTNLRLTPEENAIAYYINRGPRQFTLIVTDGQVEGFTYNEIKYTKRGFLKAKTGVRFTDNGDGTVTDNLSGLLWLKDANCADLVPPDHFETNSFFTRDDALQAAADLHDGMCGLTDGSKPGDWRLPTVAEFCGGWTNQPVGFCAEEGGLVDLKFKNPAISNAKGDAPWTEGDVFNNVYHGDEKGYHTSTPSIPPDPSKEGPFGNEHVWRFFLSWQGKWGGNGAWTLSFFPDARVWPVRTASTP